MIAYKLVRQMADGTLSPLFINQRLRLNHDEWMEAECIPTKGFAVRPGWHCTCLPKAPHLTEKKRVWIEVVIKEVQEYKRPLNQGGMWYLAQRMKVKRILTPEMVQDILKKG